MSAHHLDGQAASAAARTGRLRTVDDQCRSPKITPAVVRQAPLEEVIIVRRDILRPGDPPEVTISAVDGRPETVHFAAYIDDQIVGVASSGPEDFPFGTVDHAWRLRGLAVYPAYRRRGIGGALLAALEHHLRGTSCRLWWAHARSASLTAYIRAGFAVHGSEYDFPPTGPHTMIIMNIKSPAALAPVS